MTEATPLNALRDRCGDDPNASDLDVEDLAEGEFGDACASDRRPRRRRPRHASAAPTTAAPTTGAPTTGAPVSLFAGDMPATSTWDSVAATTVAAATDAPTSSFAAMVSDPATTGAATTGAATTGAATTGAATSAAAAAGLSSLPDRNGFADMRLDEQADLAREVVGEGPELDDLVNQIVAGATDEVYDRLVAYMRDQADAGDGAPAAAAGLWGSPVGADDDALDLAMGVERPAAGLPRFQGNRYAAMRPVGAAAGVAGMEQLWGDRPMAAHGRPAPAAGLDEDDALALASGDDDDGVSPAGAVLRSPGRLDPAGAAQGPAPVMDASDARARVQRAQGRLRREIAQAIEDVNLDAGAAFGPDLSSPTARDRAVAERLTAIQRRYGEIFRGLLGRATSLLADPALGPSARGRVASGVATHVARLERRVQAREASYRRFAIAVAAVSAAYRANRREAGQAAMPAVEAEAPADGDGPAAGLDDEALALAPATQAARRAKARQMVVEQRAAVAARRPLAEARLRTLQAGVGMPPEARTGRFDAATRARVVALLGPEWVVPAAAPSAAQTRAGRELLAALAGHAHGPAALRRLQAAMGMSAARQTGAYDAATRARLVAVLGTDRGVPSLPRR